MPLWILSGGFFPVDGAPAVLRALMLANPVTYGVAAIRLGLGATAGAPVGMAWRWRCWPRARQGSSRGPCRRWGGRSTGDLGWAGPALFGAAFAGATLLPLSSEAAFAAALAGGMDPSSALAWATAGNTLGCALNVALGRWARDRMEPRLRASRAGTQALEAVERWGGWSLALSWLPVVGDPLTVAAGVARVPLWLVAVVVPGCGSRATRRSRLRWACGNAAGSDSNRVNRSRWASRHRTRAGTSFEPDRAPPPPTRVCNCPGARLRPAGAHPLGPRAGSGAPHAHDGRPCARPPLPVRARSPACRRGRPRAVRPQRRRLDLRQRRRATVRESVLSVAAAQPGMRRIVDHLSSAPSERAILRHTTARPCLLSPTPSPRSTPTAAAFLGAYDALTPEQRSSARRRWLDRRRDRAAPRQIRDGHADDSAEAGRGRRRPPRRRDARRRAPRHPRWRFCARTPGRRCRPPPSRSSGQTVRPTPAGATASPTSRTQWAAFAAELRPRPPRRALMAHPRAGALRADGAARFIGAHIDHHARQLARLRASDGFPA